MDNKSLVSVIITTKNEERNIETCLKSIKNQTYKKIEVIVVDNNSTDSTEKISKKYTKLFFTKGPERSAQRNYGARKSKGTYLLLLDADMRLSKKVIEDCIDIVEKNKLLGVVIPEESYGKNFWAKCKALERSFYVGVDWMEAARFFSKKTFLEFKGYDESQTGTEDYDLPQRIKEKYGREKFGRINSFIYHNEGNLSLFYTLKKKNYYARTIGKYKNKSSNKYYVKKQSSILERYKLFFSHPVKLFKNPILGVGMLFMKTSEFLAGGLGYMQALRDNLK